VAVAIVAKNHKHSDITFFNCFPPPAEDISLSQIILPHSIVLPYMLSWSQ